MQTTNFFTRFLSPIVVSVLPILFLFELTGCSNSQRDNFVEFRNQTSDEIFNKGERALAKHNFSQAVKNFEALDAIYPFGPHAEQAQLDMIYAYYQNDDEPSAIAAANRYIRLYPQGRYIDYAYYMRGVIGFSQNMTWLQKLTHTDPAPRDIVGMQESFSSFGNIVRFFPGSPYAYDSRLHMIYIRNMLARREIITADYYLRRKAYVAAANRASHVFEHFQGSPEVGHALVIMVKAYQALGLTDLARWSASLLQTNYQDSKEWTEVSKLKLDE